MRDIQIHTFLSNKNEGCAFYYLVDGSIYISCGYNIENNIKNILWHEIMHKILYEEYITERALKATKQWDNIAIELEDFLFY